MAAEDENSVILRFRPDATSIPDAGWISEPSQAVAEYHIVLKLGRVPAEEIGDL